MTSLSFLIGSDVSRKDIELLHRREYLCKIQRKQSILSNANTRKRCAIKELNTIIPYESALQKELQNSITVEKQSNDTLTTCKDYLESAKSKYNLAKQIYEETTSKLNDLNSYIVICIEQSNNTELQNAFVVQEAIQNDLDILEQELYNAIQNLNQEYVHMEDAITALSEAKAKVIQIKEEIAEINTLISLAKENLNKIKAEIIAINDDI
jgi:chromosome segregation ATPase